MTRNGVTAKIHGVYWVAGGMWPIIHMESFLWVTGSKEELWLVRCVALLVILIGLILFIASHKKRITPEIKWLGLGSAAVVSVIDILYVIASEIPFVYLLDGITELILVSLWLWAGRHGVVTNFLPSSKP